MIDWVKKEHDKRVGVTEVARDSVLDVLALLLQPSGSGSTEGERCVRSWCSSATPSPRSPLGRAGGEPLSPTASPVR